ncbi:CLUMA_CG009891, isoform A [Clunio marinus]|uniref:CLUMA_CG009891, isoform A n=1 Tax=Clunio marinus TaxID=568069 RepID=A0A1J1IE31_9DIPT|nr:CLUMA_CG009891, isoform A [Clunio marinus]
MDVDTRGSSPGRERDRSRRSERTGSRFDNNDRDKSRERDNRQESRRIYISNIPYEYRWQDLKDLFRREVGDVAFVELFNDESNKPRGCGIVEFEKAESVPLALDKMNRYDLNGRNLVVKEDFGNERDKYGRVVSKVGGGGGGGGGGSSNYRMNRDRDDDRISFGDARGHGGGNISNLENFNTYGLSVKFLEGLGITGPLHTKVFVANLDYKVDAKKLKQVFKLAGRVVSLELSVDKEGNSRGFAVVEYDHPVEAVQAISLFDRQTLFDRRMTVRLDRVPEKSEGPKLPEGLKGIGIGLGPNGDILRNVALNLPNVQNNPSQNVSANTMNSLNTLNSLSNSLSQLSQQNQPVPAPVAPPNSSLLGPVPNSNSLSGLTSNLAALTNVVGGLGGLGALSNPLLSSAAASLNSLGINLNSGNDVNSAQKQQGSFNAYNTSGGFNSGNSGRVDDMSFGGNQIRNYNTSSNDDYNSRNFGNTGGNSSRKQPSDTIIVRNLPSSWTWQNLRDKFRDVGEVKFAEIRGLDTGVVRFSKEREAEVAIKLMDGSRFDGRLVEIDYF